MGVNELIVIAAGLAGMSLILIAFAMNQWKKWSQDSLLYDSVNLAGGILLVAYAMAINSIPFGVLNGVWAIVSARDIWLDIRREKGHRAKLFHKGKTEKH